MNNYKLDTDTQVFFYEQEFYVFSNFSAFSLFWRGILFPTSEAAYQWSKFYQVDGVRAKNIRHLIQTAPSAHEAFKIAEKYKDWRRQAWEDEKVDVMRKIIYAKWLQHEYVRRKLGQTLDREIIEDSWRDSFWGWGPDRKGQNMLGKLWMELRETVE